MVVVVVVVVVVASVQTDAGASMAVATELATAFALGGERVVVVDADTLAAAAAAAAEPGMERDPGLLDVLSGRVPLASAVQTTAVPQLKLLPVGRGPSDAAVRIVPRCWQETSAALSGSFDVVVVAAAPVLASADGIRVAQHATAVLVAVDGHHTVRAAVDQLLAELAQVNATVIGCVLTPGPREWRPLRRTRRLAPRIDKPGDDARGRPAASASAAPGGPAHVPEDRPSTATWSTRRGST